MRMLVRGQRPDECDPACARAALLQHLDRGTDRRLAAPRYIGLVGNDPRLRRVIDVLHKQRVALTRCVHADRLGGHRPLRQPLHRRAETVEPAEHEMIAFGFRQQHLDACAPARHLGVGKARNLRCDDAGEMGRKRHEACFGSATIMSSSMRAPGDDSELMHTVVLAGRQSPKYFAMVACMASASRKSVRYLVTFTTSRQLAPVWSRIDLIASMARLVCSSIECGCTCSASTCGCLW